MQALRLMAIGIWLCSQVSFIYAPLISISLPGNYSLNNAVTYSPNTANDSIIQITTNNVNLDLDGQFITQGNLVAGLNGIVVNPGCSNITIRNGTIQNITGTGIGVGAGCELIAIDSIITDSCDSRGFSFNGVPSAPIVNSSLENSSCMSCGQGAYADYLICFSTCTQVRIKNCRLHINGSASLANLSALRLCTIANAHISDVHVSLNSANQSLRGYDLYSVANSQLTHCTADGGGNVGSNGTLIGFDLRGSCTALHLQDCINYTTTTAGNAGTTIGFNIEVGNTNILLHRCACMNMQSNGPLFGFYSAATNVDFVECVAKHGLASNGNAVGFNFANVTRNNMIQCAIIDYVSTAGTAVGIDMQGGGGATIGGIGLIQNIIGFCTDSTGAGGYAMRTANVSAAPADLLMIQNIAYRTGAGNTGTNLFANIVTTEYQWAANSTALLQGLNANLTTAWSNIGFTPS